MDVSSFLQTKMFKGTAAGKRLQESMTFGAAAMLLELYETLPLGCDIKNEEFKMLFWVCIVSNLYIHSIFLGQRNLFAAVVFLKLK